MDARAPESSSDAQGAAHKPEPEISVAICTRDRRDSLLRAVASLAVPTRVRWELLIVDNASRDDTSAACRALVDDFPAPMRVLAEPTPGLSHARNRALAEARGRAVVFLDDDATCHEGFVDAHARVFEAEGVVATGGRILPVLPDTLRGAWRRHLERDVGGPTGRYAFGDRTRVIDAISEAPLPFGGNLGVLRSEALALGGFRPDLGFGGELVPGEETALLLQLVDRGHVMYVGDAVMDHHVDAARLTRAYYRRWHRGYGRALARMQPEQSVRTVLRGAWRPLLRALRNADFHRVLRCLERTAGQSLELRALRSRGFVQRSS